MIERARKRLSKRAKKGFRRLPLTTVALYGPDDSTATKLTFTPMRSEFNQQKHALWMGTSLVLV
jgi:hypothetical protein